MTIHNLKPLLIIYISKYFINFKSLKNLITDQFQDYLIQLLIVEP